MDFEQAINATARTNKLCKFGTWLTTQDPDLEHKMRLASPDVNQLRMHRAVKLMGYDGSPDTVRRHLEDICSCHR